jgi:hypothetical protein
MCTFNIPIYDYFHCDLVVRRPIVFKCLLIEYIKELKREVDLLKNKIKISTLCRKKYIFYGEKSQGQEEAFKRIMDMKTNVAVRRQNLNILKPSHVDPYNLNPMFKKTQNYVNDVSLMRNPKSSKSKLKELHQSEEAKLLKDVAEFRVDEGIRLHP